MIDVFLPSEKIRSEFIYLHPSGQTPSMATDSTVFVHVVDGTRDAEFGSRPSCPGARGTSELSRFVTKILADGWHILHQRNALGKKAASTYHGLQDPGPGGSGTGLNPAPASLMRCFSASKQEK
jgi:hypothetical protein